MVSCLSSVGMYTAPFRFFLEIFAWTLSINLSEPLLVRSSRRYSSNPVSYVSIVPYSSCSSVAKYWQGYLGSICNLRGVLLLSEVEENILFVGAKGSKKEVQGSPEVRVV